MAASPDQAPFGTPPPHATAHMMTAANPQLKRQQTAAAAAAHTPMRGRPAFAEMLPATPVQQDHAFPAPATPVQPGNQQQAQPMHQTPLPAQHRQQQHQQVLMQSPVRRSPAQPARFTPSRDRIKSNLFPSDQRVTTL
jgi:hypothetical protein